MFTRKSGLGLSSSISTVESSGAVMPTSSQESMMPAWKSEAPRIRMLGW